MHNLDTLDWLVILAYFLTLIGITWWASKQAGKDAESYFLAGRNLGWFLIGASIFSSNIGAEHVVGLAGTGYASGMPMAHYELHAWIVLLLGWVFLPFYARAGVFTMPEFLERRYSANARWFLSIISLVGYVLTKVAVNVAAAGLVANALLGIDFWTAALGTLLFTGAYTVVGGMRAVAYTEAFQTVIILLGSALVTFFGLQKVGGWSNLHDLVRESGHFNMWRPMSDPEYPWTGLVFGGTVVGIWYWCTDQYIVQRTLAATSLQEGRRGAIFGAMLKISPVFIFLIPGVIAYAMTKTGQMQIDDPNQAFPTIVKTLLPSGVRGLVAGGLLSALMSSLASIFNSAATLFTVDVYQKFRPEATQAQLVRTGRIATGVVVLLGLLWVPVIQSISGVLYQYLQSVQAYIAPPITAVFLLGIFSKRINEKGAIATLVVGFFLGMLRLVLEINKGSLTPDSFWHQYATINFTHLCVFLFVACVAVAIVVSLLTPPPSEAQLRGLTYHTLTPEQIAANKASYTKTDIALSVLVVIIVAVVMSYFRG